MIIVSKLKESDRIQWEELYYEYADFYNMPMNQEILNTIWSWIFDENNQFFALIAKNDNSQALGFAHCREMPSPLRGKIVGFLDDLYIKAEFRGTGCVQSIYKELKNLAKLRNWPFIRWVTAEENYQARSSYDKIAHKTQWLTYEMLNDNLA